MAKSKGFLPMTISVPAEIKRRMGRVKEEVNWSFLASQAFESKLAAIAATKEKKDMSDVIARLRESKRQSSSAAYKEGFECGQAWVEDYAESDQLDKLQCLFEERRSDSYTWEDYFNSNCGSSAYTVAERLAFVIEPQSDGDSSEAAFFWEGVAGDDAPLDKDDWVRGFAEGALDIWGRVKDQL